MAGEALQPVQTATTVRVRNGKVSTTDGPFAETKEQLGGFYMIEARDLNDAIQVASKIPSAKLGSIEVRPVSAHHHESRLRGAPVAAPLRMRVVRRETFGKGPRASLPVADVRRHVARDLALDVRRLLGAGPTFDGRPLEPRDVAVICYRHADLAASQRALHAVTQRVARGQLERRLTHAAFLWRVRSVAPWSIPARSRQRRPRRWTAHPRPAG